MIVIDIFVSDIEGFVMKNQAECLSSQRNDARHCCFFITGGCIGEQPCCQILNDYFLYDTMVYPYLNPMDVLMAEWRRVTRRCSSTALFFNFPWIIYIYHIIDIS